MRLQRHKLTTVLATAFCVFVVSQFEVAAQTETQALAAIKLATEGAARQDAQKKLETLLDSMIETYARAAALATGRAEYQTLLQQVVPDLTIYYKRRNNQSIKGLQQLINRYRPKS